MLTFFKRHAWIIDYYGLLDHAEHIFINKVENFIEPSDRTTSSGSFRQYTGRIGWKIWESSPIFGVGIGMSQYHMHIYEYKMGIETFGETLAPGIFPHNIFSNVFAEQGIIGGGALIVLLLYSLKKLWHVRNYDNYTKMFLMGTLCNIAGMLANGIVYSLFLWVFIFVGLAYAKHVEYEMNSEYEDIY